jgi:hypothetical protein|tara:strand:+ start:4420 stop:4941 length:522 start_codon:yes stop_codon:yes gene_type:complete
MYFDRGFPKTNYDVDGNGVTVLAEDILTRIIIRDKAFSTYTAFAKHFVEEHETPESIATAAYGRPTYHWVVLMFNRMFDRYYDWPLTERQLQLYSNDKYDDGDDIHHYEAPQTSGDTNTKLIVESTAPFAMPITNLEYERNLNDERKVIWLLKPEYLGLLEYQFNALKHGRYY